MNIEYTQYRSMFSIDDLRSVTTTWPALVDEFSQHLRLGKKEQAPGFGPYTMRPTGRPCIKHKGGDRPKEHRCDDCVTSMTLAVFDVDVGTLADISQCQGRLKEAGLTHLFYSSYSYTHEDPIPKFRLVLPLAEPLHPDEWQPFREAVIRRFSIPADIKACSGVSHFYFLPSCPVDGDPVVDYVEGRPLDASTIEYAKPQVGRSVVLEVMEDWGPEADPTGPIDLEPFLTKMTQRARGLKMRHDWKDNEKGEWLGRCARGEALADHGERNTATARVAGMLSWMFPDQPLAVLWGLMRPSVRAMQAAGSSVKDSEVERLLLTGLRTKAEQDARADAIQDVVKAAYEKFKKKNGIK